MKRAGMYFRVSTAEQADSRLGLDSQIRLCVEALRRVEPTIQSEPFTDAGVSGSIPLALRKQGRWLVDKIEAGEIGIVVALTQDRLFRGLLDTLATLERWHELGVRVLLVDGGWIDTEDDDRFMSAALRGLFAEMERRAARKRTKRALRAAADRGLKLGGVPFGYKSAAQMVDGRKVGGGVHVPVETEQQTIRMIRAMRNEKLSFREIALYLNSRSVPSARGERWHSESVRRTANR